MSTEDRDLTTTTWTDIKCPRCGYWLERIKSASESRLECSNYECDYHKWEAARHEVRR